MRSKFLFISFFCYLNFLFAQEPAHFIVGKDALDGLALYSMNQDDRGNLWISSNKGLIKYNGVEFKFLQSGKKKYNSLFGLTKDNSEDLYCFSLNGNVYKVINDKLKKVYSLSKKNISDDLRSIGFDNLNNLILFTYKRKLTIDLKSFKLITIEKDKGIHPAKNNESLFYGSSLDNNQVGIVSLLDNKEKKEFSFKKTDNNNRLLTESPLWIVNNTIYGYNKFYAIFFKLEKGKIIKIDTNFKINQQTDAYYSKNSFWFTNIKNGTNKLDVNQINTSFKSKQWFSDYYISGAYTDLEGNTWLLTFGEGLIMIPNINVTANKNKDLRGINRIDNKIFLSTKNDEIFELKNNKLKLFFKTKSDRLGRFNIFKNEDIIVTQNSIYLKGVKHPNVVNFNRKATIIGDTIFAALHSGLYSYNFKSKKRNPITNKRTSNLYQSKSDSAIWVCSNSGLFKYKKGKINYIKHNNKPIYALDVTELENNNLLVVTSYSTLIFDKKGVFKKEIPVTGDLKGVSINQGDYEYPYIYLSSDKVIQQINTENDEVKSFTYAEGLTSSIKRFKVLNDTVYALNSKGYFSFSFKAIPSKIKKYNVQITNAKVNGFKSVIDNVSLPSNQNNIEFLFNTNSFKYQKNLNYYYQLKGYDSTFVKAKNNQYFAKYSKIPAGKYTFSVKSVIGNHENNSAEFKFTVEKHWSKGFWFIAISLGLLLLLIFYTYKNWTNTLKRKKRESELKTRLVESSLISLKAQMNPHFMFNAINSVQSLILKSEKDEAYNYLTKFSRLIRESLKMSDKTWVFLDEEIEQITNYLELEKLRFNSNFSFKVNVDFDNYQIKIPSMVIQPFVENSIKHGLLHKKEHKSIKINFYLNESSVICIIEDSGVGRAASKEINQKNLVKHTSFSTQAIKKRFKLLKEYLVNDSLGFEYEDLYDNSNKPKGTKVRINLPFLNEDQL